MRKIEQKNEPARNWTKNEHAKNWTKIEQAENEQNIEHVTNWSKNEPAKMEQKIEHAENWSKNWTGHKLNAAGTGKVGGAAGCGGERARARIQW